MIEDLLIAAYPWTKTLHIVSVISWMAGLFYLPRLYVYHVEKAQDQEALAVVYDEMERKLLRFIMGPASIATWIFGLLLAVTPGILDWSEPWVWIKAIAVIAMTGFHHLLMKWRRELEARDYRRTGRFFRLWNEAPTVLMLVIVAMVIVRPF